MLKVSESWCNNFNLDLYFLFFQSNLWNFHKRVPVLCSVYHHCHLLRQVYSSSMFRSPPLSSATPGIFQFYVSFTTIIICYTRYIPVLCSVHPHYHLLHQVYSRSMFRSPPLPSATPEAEFKEFESY